MYQMPQSKEQYTGIVSPSYFRKHKTIKIIQLIFEAIIGLLYFIMIIANESVAAVIFTNRPVLYMSFFMWILLLVCFAGSFYDFYCLQASMNSSKLLGEIAYLDATTGIPNRNSCDEFLRLFKTAESIQNAGCAVFTITNLSTINNSFGHTSGNIALKALSSILEEAVENYGFVGRNGSNDFLAIIDDCSEAKMNAFISHFNELLERYNNTLPELDLCVNHTYILNSELKATDIYEMIRTVYQKLFRQ